LIVNEPLASVLVPVLLPFTTTEADATGSLPDKTLPVTGIVWAEVVIVK